MALTEPGYPPTPLAYLPRAAVIERCAAIDAVAVVRDALRAHGGGAYTLPDEAYLGWADGSGAQARSLAMPGALAWRGITVRGLKVINASLANPARGLARAQGLVVLFDPDTAWPAVVMEAAYISALRTAALTMVAIGELAVARPRKVALLGCGILGRTHLRLLPTVATPVDELALFDTNPDSSHRLRQELAGDPAYARVGIAVDPRECVAGADVVITTTTVTRGYLRHSWFQPGALICLVSLDDVVPEVVARADLLVVDDWNLVSQDRRRLLGRLYHEGSLRGPDGAHHPDATPDPAARRVDATLGQIVGGLRPGRRAGSDIVLCNPFGMAILDLAIAAEVWAGAARDGGDVIELPR